MKKTLIRLTLFFNLTIQLLAASQADESIAPGTQVRVSGLTRATEHNGIVGTYERYNPENNRHIIALSARTQLALRRANFEIYQSQEIDIFQQVIGGVFSGLAQSLTGAAEQYPRSEIASSLREAAEGVGSIPRLIAIIFPRGVPNHLQGFSKEALQTLGGEESYQGEEETNKCSVCLEFFKSGDLTRKLVCDHLYHKKCIDSWLEKAPTCPVCRKDLRR